MVNVRSLFIASIVNLLCDFHYFRVCMEISIHYLWKSDWLLDISIGHLIFEITFETGISCFGGPLDTRLDVQDSAESDGIPPRHMLAPELITD